LKIKNRKAITLLCVLWSKTSLGADGGCLGWSRRWRTWGACDKPRGGGYQPLIRGFPNGETQHGSTPCYHAVSPWIQISNLKMQN